MSPLKVALVAALILLAAAPAPASSTLHHDSFSWQAASVQVLTVPAGASVRPVAARPGLTVPGWVKREGAIAAINGGYFNHSDGWPVSHVVTDGVMRTKPEANRALLANPALKPILPRIFADRVEWRALATGNALNWAIAPHAAPVPGGERLVHALQAGPALLPQLDLAKEGFVIRDAHGRITRDGIASTTRAARSALGLTSDGSLLLVAAGGAKQGLTISQLAALMAHLHAVSAMALDGGSSTTLVWREGKTWHTFVGSGKAPALVNSALVVEP